MITGAWIQHAVALLLVIAVPIWDRAETRRLKRTSDPQAKIRSYRRVVVFLWATAPLVVIAVPTSRLWRPPPMEGAAVSLFEARGFAMPVLAGFAIALAAPVVLALTNPRMRARLTKPLEAMNWFLPETSRERWWFAAVCVSAGVCEEIIYRGFLIRYLATLPLDLGLTGSVLVAAFIFMLGHTYQGFLGALSVACLALLFTAVFFFAGSLWLPMLLHAVIDLRTLLLWRGRTGAGSAGNHAPNVA